MNNFQNQVVFLKEFYRGRKVLLTGIHGFKGSILAALLTNFGAEVHGLGLPNENDYLFNTISQRLNLKEVDVVDIKDRQAMVKEILRINPEIIFHLAAQPIVSLGYQYPASTFESNFNGTMNVLEGIRYLQGKVSAVMVTTDKVYRDKNKKEGYTESDEVGGHDPYSSSKAACAVLIESYNKSFFLKTLESEFPKIVSDARAGNVIGGGDFAADRLIPDIWKAFASSQGVEIRNFDAVRPFQHVLDCVFAYALLAAQQWENTDLGGTAYNIGPNPESELTVRNITDFFAANPGVEIIDGSNGIKMHETSLLRLDSSKFRKALNWEPRLSSPDQILGYTLEWYSEWVEASAVKGSAKRLLEKRLSDITNIQIEKFLEGEN